MKTTNAIRVVCSTVKLIRNSGDLEDVIKLADIVVKPDALERYAKILNEDPAIRASFKNRIRIAPMDLKRLKALPEGTLGREFHLFVKANDIDPSSLPIRPHSTDAEYIMAHLYETHDIYHVVTGFGTDVAGELGVQGFYAAQSPNPHALLLLGGGLFNTMLYNMNRQDAILKTIVRGWLLGKSSRILFGTNWNELWHLPLADVREQFGIRVEAVNAIAPGGHENFFADRLPITETRRIECTRQ